MARRKEISAEGTPESSVAFTKRVHGDWGMGRGVKGE